MWWIAHPNSNANPVGDTDTDTDTNADTNSDANSDADTRAGSKCSKQFDGDGSFVKSNQLVVDGQLKQRNWL